MAGPAVPELYYWEMKIDDNLSGYHLFLLLRFSQFLIDKLI